MEEGHKAHFGSNGVGRDMKAIPIPSLVAITRQGGSVIIVKFSLPIMGFINDLPFAELLDGRTADPVKEIILPPFNRRKGTVAVIDHRWTKNSGTNPISEIALTPGIGPSPEGHSRAKNTVFPPLIQVKGLYLYKNLKGC